MQAVRKEEILLVEDERIIRQLLAEVLANAGYLVRTAANGEQALKLHRQHRADLVILDVMMPGMDGYELCRRIRASDTSTPVIFLTALDSDKDELRGLEAGADIYIPKTVSPEVILGRIAAVIRRHQREEPTGDFVFGSWRVTPAERAMHGADGRREALSEREIAALRIFSLHQGEVISRDYLLLRLWGDDADIGDNALTMAIARLRDKLGDDAGSIESVRGCGYAFRP